LLDLKIARGWIYDGSGRPPTRGEIGVRAGRIVGVAETLAEPAREVVDAGGLAVAPGFIDLHTHSDVSILSSPECLSAICQGVTTQVVGLCGYSAAPVSREAIESLVEEEPIYGFPDVVWDWTGVGAYLEAVGRARPATNVVTFVGHNTLRRTVVGLKYRAATVAEQARMRDLLRESLREGARGFTTGLSYAPGCYASIDELVDLAKVAAREGCGYHTHMRYGLRSVSEALAEAIETAERSGVALNVSHLYPSADRWGRAQELIDTVESARRRGVEVTFDLTVFRRGGGPFPQRIPLWARDGGQRRLVERIRDEATRARIKAEMEPLFLRDLGGTAVDWADIVVCKVDREEHIGWLGRSIDELARERGQDPADTALLLVVEDGQYWVAPTAKSQDDLDLLIRHPLCVPIGDGISTHPDKHKTMAMPKSFGTFPYVLGSYVRERKVLSLEEAIRRMTAVPAERLGLTTRGRLVPGGAADLVLFRPEEIRNNADEAHPAAWPTGIVRVMVNGEWVVADGSPTGQRPGWVL
jgi:N-acyl-D-amino-acid deacylase